MEITTISFIKGACEGFKKDRIFELANGAKWQQIVDQFTHKSSMNAIVQIWTEHKRNYLEISGMSPLVQVKSV